ncbi:uncharacterized protein G2W53_010322 [Senna tora]|uniref:Uncharacterized protein n=1 Tax=Senna tora TaxID=362788 RepID=A0A834WZP0_9FABA|nr:uncharacterized protein G2W53_010322 [Senna tora]
MAVAWIMSQLFRTTNRVGSQKPYELRGKACCASESNTSVRVVLANRVVLMLQLESSAWEDVDHVSTYSGRQIASISETFTITRQTCCARAWIMSQLTYPTTNRGRISETFTNYEAKDLLPSESTPRRVALYLRTGVVLMLQLESSRMGGAWIMSQHIPDDKSRSDLMNLHELRGKRLVAQVSQHTSVRDVLTNQSGFDASIGLVWSWEERGSCLNIFRTTSRGRISETFTNYEAKDLLRKWVNKRRFALYLRIGVVLMLQLESSPHGRSVDHVSATYSDDKSRSDLRTFTNYEAKDLLRRGAWIMSQHIPDDKSRSDIRNLHELRGKRLVAQVSQTCRFALYLRTGVVLMLQWRSLGMGRSVHHVSTYSRRQIAVVSQKPSRIQQKTCCNSFGSRCIRERSGFDAPIGVVLAWDERGSCLNLFRTTNRGRISETFTNYEA